MTVTQKRNNAVIPKRKRRKWTSTKLSYLEEHVSHMTYTDIAERINMPPSSVRSKAIQLGIQRDHCIGYYKDEYGDYYQWEYKRQKWTEKDKQYLQKNHNKYLVVELARILNRKYNSVYQQLRVMGYTPLTTKDWRVVFNRYLTDLYMDRNNPVLLEMLKQGITQVGYRSYRYIPDLWELGSIRVWVLKELFPTLPTMILTKIFGVSNSTLWRVIRKYGVNKHLPIPHNPTDHYKSLACRLDTDPEQLRIKIGKAALDRRKN